MENSQPHSFHGNIIMQQPNGQLKVVTASPSNSTGIPKAVMAQHNECPMMLNAWTQTPKEGIDHLHNENAMKFEGHTAHLQDLLEKIHTLEENLRAHSDILARMQANQSNSNVVVQEKPHPLPTKPPVTLPQNPQDFQQYAIKQIFHAPQQERHQQQYKQAGAHYNNHNIVPDNFQVLPKPNSSVNYTIVTDADVNDNNKPIEFQMTAENATNSVNTGCLQTCLEGETGEAKTVENSVPTQMCRPQQDSQYSTSSAENTGVNKISYNEKLIHATKYYINNPSTLVNALKTVEVHNRVPFTLKQENVDVNTPNQKEQNVQNLDAQIDPNNAMISLGPGNTRVPAKIYENISWGSPSLATRKLLMTVFDRHTLATHSMSGKPSPAFKNDKKPLKGRLNQNIVNDIIYTVTRKCHTSVKEVRNAITTKCADENKMMKLRENHQRKQRETNKENINE